MDRGSRFIVKPNPLSGGSMTAEYYSADSVRSHRRSVLRRAWDEWRSSDLREIANDLTVFLPWLPGLVGGYAYGSFFAFLLFLLLGAALVQVCSMPPSLVWALRQDGPECPDLEVTFRPKVDSIDRDVVAEAINKNYGEVVHGLLGDLHGLIETPGVSRSDRRDAVRTVEGALGTLGELAGRDVVELWGGATMPPSAREVVDRIAAIDSALTDVKELGEEDGSCLGESPKPRQ